MHSSRPLLRAPAPAAGSRALAAAAGSLAVGALVLLVLQQHQASAPAALLADYHGWLGCGVGGSCGPAYHWTAEAYSPVAGQSTYIHMSHDHASFANYVNNDTKAWVVGAHKEFPYTQTSPSEYDISSMPLAGMAVNPDDLEDPMEYFGKMFPVYKGYSAEILPNSPMEIHSIDNAYMGMKDADEEGEEGEEGEGSEDGASEDDSSADDESSEDADKEGSEEEEEEEPKEEEEAALEHPHGGSNPMIFEDLSKVGGREAVKLPERSGYVPWWERIGLKTNADKH